MTSREVELSGGAPWGFRMHGGVDQNQPLRISRVNPGRKASLSGIREGDVISSINGRSTKSMSNADAHGMLRSAGPTLRLGLNEDREMSPRRRSIGKGGELRRPSQLLTDIHGSVAVPQAPVYATIRPSQLPHNRPSSSQMRSSLNSLPSALNSTQLVKSAAPEEPLQLHPTNPFYTTLPSNYTSATKLPIPNSRAGSHVDRHKKVKENYYGDLKPTQYLISGPSSLPFSHSYETHDYKSETKTANENGYHVYNDKFKNESLPNHAKNPFEPKRISDPFEKYLRPKLNGDDGPSMSTSQSDSSFYKNHETIERKTITEHKISEVEEVKTIKKFTLSASDDTPDDNKINGGNEPKASSPQSHTYFGLQSGEDNYSTPKQEGTDLLKANTERMFDDQRFLSPNDRMHEQFGNTLSSLAEASTEVVTSRPPVKSPVAHAPTPSPTQKPIWHPGAPTPQPDSRGALSPGAPPLPPPPPVWTPASAGASPQPSRRAFRPVHFEETPPTRRKFGSAEQNGCTSGSESEGRLRTSHSAPATGLNNLGGSQTTSRLPRAQNPTVTLLQKAREGQLPRGSSYLQQERDNPRLPRDRPSPPRGDPVHELRQGYNSETEGCRSETEHGRRTMADAHRKVEGIGPTTKEGMPVALRSEVKDPSKWYKKMYDTIHKNKYDDDYVTIRYKNRRGDPQQRVSSNKSHYAYFDPRSGYLSEPEGGLSRVGSSWSDAYDSDVTTQRRRTASVQENKPYSHSNKFSTLASARASQEVYKNQPGRIENYTPGKSSVIDKEAKQWWDEVMDIFDGWLDENSPLPPYSTLLARAIQKSQNVSSTTSLPQALPKEKKDITSAILSKSNMARALKESGYESDSTLVFRRREDTEGPLSPAERRAAYRDLQAGGEPPLKGFRSPAPPRQDESEIEYIPISPTLTKIRVHKKSSKVQDVICYPVTSIKTDKLIKYRKQSPSFITIEVPRKENEYPPAPPRRVSSKNSTTLKLITYNRPKSVSPKRCSSVQSHSNVDFLRNKLSNQLLRQNTQILSKKPDAKIISTNNKVIKARVMSTSAPPAINRKTASTPSVLSPRRVSDNKPPGTSSFGSPRRILEPTEYSNSMRSKYGESQYSMAIEGGAGKRTPITSILDKVTTIDKLWSSAKRNERIDITKVKSVTRLANCTSSKLTASKSSSFKSLTPNGTHRSRDMTRTAEKVQKLKSSSYTKSHPCLAKSEMLTLKPNRIQTSSTISKSSYNLNCARKQNQIKTATVTNLKKKNSLENVIVRPRSHESCSKKSKDSTKNKASKMKKINKNATIPSYEDSESCSQFGDITYETSNYGSYEDLGKRCLSSKEIQKTRQAVMSDSFFQHLFLGGNASPIILSYPLLESNTVLQKAKLFQSYPQDYNASKSLNTYLINRKPVSLSRFKLWDRYLSPVRTSSPRSISWPGKLHSEIKKNGSLSKCDEFGSMSSLSTVRSKSEPPVAKMYFSQTSRPISPTVVFYKKTKRRESPKKTAALTLALQERQQTIPTVTVTNASKARNQSLSPTRIVFTETVRPISPTVIKKAISKSETSKQVEIPEPPSIMYFSQTSRPASPKVLKKSVSRSHSTSPVSTRSPSYRRIHSARVLSGKNDTITKRTKSADNADRKSSSDNLLTKSDYNLQVNDPEYDEYLQDIENSKVKSERFSELNRYYSYLERVGELEKATSTCDLRHRRKDEEIIDFDRWKKIRSIERAEDELNHLYYKLRIAQNEKDMLFYPRDVKDFRWNYDSDRGLRIKEKSVEDLKDQFQQSCDYNSLEIDQQSLKDTYKPLWRGTSVAETAFNINKKNIIVDKRTSPSLKPTVAIQKDSSFYDLRKKIGLGSRLWSSLSMDQVNTLKNQLNAIYSKELESKLNKDTEDYVVDVPDIKNSSSTSLHVRCNSFSNSRCSPTQERDLCKSDSIAAIPCPVTTVKELKNNVNKIHISLSENEKKKISQTLSRELLDRISKFNQSVPLPCKKVSESDNNNNNEQNDLQSLQREKLPVDSDTVSNKDEIRDDGKRYVVYPSDKEEPQNQSSASETDTASSDISNKTVIYKGPCKEVQKKVEYFESVKKLTDQPKVIYHARDSSDEKERLEKKTTNVSLCVEIKAAESQKPHLVQSQSCTNFKDLFGESERNKFLSLPSKPEMKSRADSPKSEVHVSDRSTPDTLRYSSNETIWRSRSPSPDPERYWRAYLNLARAGEVRRLARRFDSPSAASAVLRRYRSDPEISRNVLLHNWSSLERYMRYEKFKPNLPVARVPLRPANRYMPHIDIISKLASLRRRTVPRSRSTDEVPECRAGEVEKMRRRFETMSLLGQIYASAPDVSELRDIAPYLEGSWMAHQYPKRSDNNRSLKDPSSFVKGQSSPVKKQIRRSLPKQGVRLSSILKSDAFTKQEFDPAIHRPTSRYEPPRAPPRPPPASWPYCLAPFVTPSRHTVKFQDTDSAPEPPRRAPNGSYSDAESPSRRYVESDVNIHYRCPVRHDPLPLVPERELARQQAEHMKRLYREQKRNKYLQELQDMQNRRHQDNFTPSQKNILPLNRYDDTEKIVARALYAFNGQTPRELSFRKGDMIQVRRQIDANWYEGEIHGRIGLFPYNYVELLKGDAPQSPKKPQVVEGRARAKFDFTAQTNLELPLKKGEVVVLTRRIDHNWWEGRNGGKTGIFPDSYVTILQEPSQNKPEPKPILNTDKPMASPAAHGLLLNGSAKRSMGPHSYMPQHNNPALANAPPSTQPLPGYTTKPSGGASLSASERGYGPPTGKGVDLNNREPLYVDTNAEAIPYRAMYKYRPQNPDELELNEGDTVYVLEKCDDGWYVGSSQRSGRFGTFPGNYVERI